MKMILIECDAEELRANRTVMDSVTNALNNFASNMFGVSNIDWSKLNDCKETSEEVGGLNEDNR